MPNETLLLQLTQLTDTYLLRQKRAAAVLSAFKLTGDALSKTVRALQEYAAEDSMVAAAQDAFARVKVKEEGIDPLAPELRREVKNLTLLLSALKEASNALRAEPVDVARLDKALVFLLIRKEAAVAALIPSLQSELDLAQRALGDEFGVKLRAALESLGVHLGGRPPKFTIGRFELDANFARRSCVLRYGKDTVAPHVSITVEAALKAYLAAVKEIENRPVGGSAWLAQLYEAYQMVQRKRASTASRVNVVDVYLELVMLRQGRTFAGEPSKRTFTEYSRAQFIYDFYRITGQQRLVHQGMQVKVHSATKSQTDSPAKSMWIVEGDSPYDGRYIADIEFEKEQR